MTASGRGPDQMELPTEGQARLAVWVRGEVWSYKEGSIRIYSFAGEEINVWDHAAGAPGIEFTRQGIEARVEKWLDDEADDSEPQSPAAAARQARIEAHQPLDGIDHHDPAVERYGWNGDEA